MSLGFCVPLNTAASIFWAMDWPTASCTSPHTSNEASLSTASGIGVMLASSSAFRKMPSHAALVVCLSPVSPWTQ